MALDQYPLDKTFLVAAWLEAASLLYSGSVFISMRILIESAALYLLVEILLLARYAVNYNVQYIILETVTPIAKKIANMATQIEVSNVQTIGSIPMRRIVIGRQVEQVDDMENRFAKETRLADEEAV
ncbi:hypothetical protein B0H16DRAFT_1469687 [Mycena metata]|uniref:Uncharacterized protein n=1 Tax=Mycena metata TaxID=1033252 RepID=A0AAD7HZ37_9AGAR|nr:hypothetical protein B0H16DRAFT_1469687 [Mycena metata]